MSISPPSDIVLDVARAADPARYREAAAKLGTARPTTPFADTLTDVALRETPAKPAATARTVAAKTAEAKTADAKTADDAKTQKTKETYRAFEAMTLATMLQSAMTSSTSSYFGEGVAGDTWKSLMVEQIANQMAKNGGVGIADQLTRSAKLAMADTSPAEPQAAQTLLTTSGERALIRALDEDDSGTTG